MVTLDKIKNAFSPELLHDDYDREEVKTFVLKTYNIIINDDNWEKVLRFIRYHRKHLKTLSHLILSDQEKINLIEALDLCLKKQ